MNDELKQLLENQVLSESVKASIVEAWENKVSQLREEVANEIRDEFSAKYEKDKSEIVEAMDVMIQDVIKESVLELQEAKKEAMLAKVQAKKAVKEGLNKINDLVKTVLESELKELAEDRKVYKSKLQEVEKLVKEGLEHELKDFHEEKRKLIEDRVKFKRDSRKKLEETKEQFIKQSAKVAEKFIVEAVTSEISQFKEEINEARKKNFGLKLFESFAAEYATSFFSHSKEAKKLLNAIKDRDAKLAEATEQLGLIGSQLTESKKKEVQMKELIVRKEKLNELMAPLSGSKRELMLDLLDKVQTNKLQESFDLYLPSVLENTSSKKVLNESAGVKEQLKEVSGDRKTLLGNNQKDTRPSVVDEVVGKLHNMDKYVVNKSVI